MTIFATSSLRVSAKYLLVASSDLFISGAGMPSSYVRVSASCPVAGCLWGRWSVGQQKVSVAGRKARFRSRKKTYYGVRSEILNKIPKSWSNRNVVVRVCGGVARGSCVLIEASSIRPDAMTFRLYSSNSHTPVTEVFCICDGPHDEEKMQRACESVFPICRALHPAQLPLDFRRLFTSGRGANEPLR